MSAQNSYSINQSVALAGIIYALHPHDINSFSVETSDGIDFAVAVKRGTDKDNQIDLAGSADFVGITVRSLDREGAANGDIIYKEKETAAVLADGYIWATCPTGCNAGDAVKYTDDTGVLDAGAAGAGETQLDDAEWFTTASAGELAVIKLSGTNTTAGA